MIRKILMRWWVSKHLSILKKKIVQASLSSVSLQIDHELHTNANSNTFRAILGNGLKKCNLCARNVYSLQYYYQCPQAPQRPKDSFTWLTSAFPQCTEPYSAKHEATAFLFMLFHVLREVRPDVNYKDLGNTWTWTLTNSSLVTTMSFDVKGSRPVKTSKTHFESFTQKKKNRHW